MDRLEFLKAQPWLDEVASDEWPASGELFAGTCVLELVGDVGTSPLAAQLHFRSGLLGSSTQTGVRLALQRSETPAAAATGAGAKRTRDDGAPPAAPARGARLLATFEASGRTCVAHLRHTQIRRMTDNSAAASEQRDVPYLRLEFDHVALVLRALPSLHPLSPCHALDLMPPAAPGIHMLASQLSPLGSTTPCCAAGAAPCRAAQWRLQFAGLSGS